ncbi:hypothetical protein [Sneathiella chinensis]|uniref:Uncharacterized protein n=1 Tax=Sneathiella chinensis TaxID=349750 RepID=A0ABQ5U6H4_9PROT|nr:hypothetical protein [Sneathiella chinensis]GLQ07757.1 hypothetical protein GCM10007924_29780 [Sneathiella chinensis]
MKKILACLVLGSVAIGSTAAVTPSAMASQRTVKDSDEALDIVFSEIERRIIRDFFRDRDDRYHDKKHKSKKGLPPGLAKKDTLPPGLAKQLARNGTLPPGLAKRDLPRDLYYRLPHRDGLYERVIVGNDVVLLKRGANLIYDIIKDIVN